MKQYLEATPILDYRHPMIQDLLRKRKWNETDDRTKIRAIYNFVRDEIKFGYNEEDAISASRVLEDGYGQCNTKANLFMALLRATGIPARIRGFTIHKALQRGAITGLWYVLAPKNILHSWVEVYYRKKWYHLEGIILDTAYLSALQRKFSQHMDSFCGYGVCTGNFSDPPVDWNENNTYIQDRGINRDFGLFDSPDAFYAKHKQQLSPLQRWVYRKYVRHVMNKNLDRIRNEKGAH